MLRRLIRKPVTWVATAVVLVVAVFGLFWFAPWKLFTSKTVDEALSAPVPVATGSNPAVVGQASVAPSAVPAAPAGPVVVSSGTFLTHEHATSGTARIVRLPDGSHQLELVGLATSDGPDLRVWLTDQPADSGWFAFDDGRWAELGKLKGNRGNQVYELPASVDPAAFRSVSIWCKRFSVSFGAAELRPAP